jgi:hypothetical protein
MGRKLPDEITSLLGKVHALSVTEHNIDEQARILGVSVEQLYTYRARARAAGFNIPGADRGRKPENLSKLRALDKTMRGRHCPKCFLRGEHECVSLDTINTSGPGQTYPEPVDETFSVRNGDMSEAGTENIYNAATRVGVDRAELCKRLMLAGERPPMRRSQWRVRKEVVDRVAAEMVTA